MRDRARKPLPQFTSLKEAQEFYSKYGKLIYWGRVGRDHNACLFSLDVIDGRKLTLWIYEDGKVEESPIS